MRTLVLLVSTLLAVPAAAQEPSPETPKIPVLIQRAQAALEAEDWDTAIEACDAVLAQNPRVGAAWFFKGYALHAQKNYDEALPAHLEAAKDPQVRPTALYNAACVHAIRGNADAAFERLDQSVEAGFANASVMRDDADLANIKDDPRFTKLLTRIESGDVGTATVAQSFPPAVEQRKATRLFLYTNADGGFRPLGQVFVGWGPIDWKPEYGAAIESGRFDGIDWRLGRNFWTTLDTNLPITLGGVELEPGAYYLSVSRTKQGEYRLGIHDPAARRAEQVDPFQLASGSFAPEHRAAMTHTTLDENVSELTLTIDYEIDPTDSTFHVEFGPHRLSCPLEVRL